jgi:hypothetical protein
VDRPAQKGCDPLKDMTTALAVIGLIFKQTDISHISIERKVDDTIPFKIHIYESIPSDSMMPLIKLVIQEDLMMTNVNAAGVTII